MESERPYDALIIGAGIGGLSAGICLLLLGQRVAVVEKNVLPGGLMRGYRRAGMDCPVGVHYFGAFGEGEPLRRICDYLGLSDGLAAERMGRDSPIDRYHFDEFTFDLPAGIDAFAAALRQAFPAEGQAIGRITADLLSAAEMQNSFAFLSPQPPLFDAKLYAPLSAYLSGMDCSPGLRSVLGVAARWMGMQERDCPAFYHHFALSSYLLSAWRLAGAGADLAEAFVARVEALGGEMICGDAVAQISAAEGAVTGVRLASGRVLSAARIVAAIHPKQVIAMLPAGLVKPRHARLVAELAETESLFALNAAVDAAAHPALPHNVFRLRTDREGTITDGVFSQMRRAEKGKNLLVLITKSPYREWQRWERSATGSRGPDYAEEKARRAGRLLREAEGLFGSLADATLLDAYTPLTLRDWVGTPEGSPYGIMRSMRQLPALAALSRLAPAGLTFAGQSALSPGVLGTLLGSLHAVRQVIGPHRFAAEVFGPLAGSRKKRELR